MHVLGRVGVFVVVGFPGGFGPLWRFMGWEFCVVGVLVSVGWAGQA